MTGPPIVRLSIGYGAGLWAGLVFLIPPGGGLALAAALGAGSVMLRAWQPVLGGAALGFASAAARSRARAQDCAIRWKPGRHRVMIQLHDRSSGHGLRTGNVEYSPEGCAGTIRLRLDSATAGGIRMVAVGTASGTGVLRVTRFRVMAGPRPFRFVVRDAIGRRIETLYGPRAPLVEALITGRRDELPRELERDFVAAGLAHVLAISGMHVGIMAGWCLLLFRLFLRRRPAAAASAGAAWSYVALIGFPAPAARAAALVTIAALGRVLRRHPHANAAMAGCVLVVLMVDPGAVTSVGAWLSFAAVWGTDEAVRLLPPRWKERPAAVVLASSAGATAATAPITAYVFGAVAPIGIVANLVAVPLSSLAVPAVFLSLLPGGWLAPGAGLALAGVERSATLAAAVPAAQLTGPPGLAFALPWAALLGVLIWVRHRRPTWVVARRRLLLSAAVALWVLAVPRHESRHLEIHVLDVGQGDGIAIRSPEGRWMLVDAGPRTAVSDAGRNIVLPFLRKHGVRRLEAVVVSHGHADHLGGVPAVMEQLEPALVAEPGQPLADGGYLNYLGFLEDAGVEWRAARLGDTLVLGGVHVAVLHPTDAWLRQHDDPNENSVVLWVRYREFDALLTGDVGFPAESLLLSRVGPVEVLKVGHHGSAGSTSASWLARLRPAVGVISVGENRYGHPAPAVLERLEGAGVRVWRTDRGGTVTISTDGRYFWVAQQAAVSNLERLRCRVKNWSRSSDSSSARKSCTAARRESYPTSSAPLPSPPR